MSTRTMVEAAKVLADPTAYADDDRLHSALTHLRANNPVAWVDNRPYRPFWAITKHADIMAIERDNELFISEPRPLLTTAAGDDIAKAQLESGMGLRTVIHMDDPHRRKVRAIGADWFRPKAMRDLKVRVDELAKRYVDKLRDVGPECDFVTEIAVNFPLYVIMSLLGLPESDFGRMHGTDPGDVRRRRRRVQAGRHPRGAARGAARLLQILRRAHRIPPRAAHGRPGICDRQRPHRR